MKRIKITSMVLFFALVVMVAQPYVFLAGKVVSFPGTVIVSSASTTTVAVTGVTLTKKTAALKVGASVKLSAVVAPSDATDKTVSWSSSNTKVATVTSAGNVTAKAKGTAKITVKTTYGAKTASCVVTVTQPVTGVKLSKATATLLKGKTLKLTATVLPATASNKKVPWKSSSAAIATVSSLGVVTGKKAGIATITVTSVDGKKTAKCKVTVK